VTATILAFALNAAQAGPPAPPAPPSPTAFHCGPALPGVTPAPSAAKSPGRKPPQVLLPYPPAPPPPPAAVARPPVVPAPLYLTGPVAGPPIPAVRAVPRLPLGAYILDIDYPVSAIRKLAQGTVGYRLEIAPDGRVAVCQVTASSGHQVLDATTCRIFRARARFAPARNAADCPVGDVATGRIHWILPPEPPGTPPRPPQPMSTASTPGATLPPSFYFLDAPPDPNRGPPAIRARAERPLGALVSAADYPDAALRKSEQGRVGLRLGIDAHGGVTSCAVAASSGSAALDAASCALVRARARFAPARTAKHDAVPDVIDDAIGWTLPDAPAQPVA
jgi:protein TonB